MPHPLPQLQRLLPSRRVGRGAPGAAPRAPNSPGLPTRPSSAPPPRLSRSGGARAGRGEGGRERREEEPRRGADGGRGPRLGAAGSPRGGGRRGGGAQLRRPPAGGAGGRAAAVPHHVGVLQASPLLLRLRSEWTAAAAAAPLTGLPGSRSCAVRGGPGAARGGSPGPRGGGGTGAGVRHPAWGFPWARGPPGRGARAGEEGGRRTPLHALTSSRRAGRSPAGWGAGGHPPPLPTRSFRRRTVPAVSRPFRGGDEWWPIEQPREIGRDRTEALDPSQATPPHQYKKKEKKRK